MAYIEQHYNLEWTKNTGPLGDTFGGLLSPIIGLVSVYFIYETFKAQREQLIEQKLASEASLSLQREQLKDQKRINDVTISSNMLSVLSDYLTTIEAKFNIIEYFPLDYNRLSEVRPPFKGMSAFYQFNTMRDKDLIIHLYNGEREFLNNVSHLLTEIQFISNTYFNDGKSLTIQDQSIFRRRLFVFISSYLPTIASIFKIVYSELHYNANLHNVSHSHVINYLVTVYGNYTGIINSLNEQGFIEKVPIKIVSSEEFYAPEDVDWEIIKNIKEFQILPKLPPID